MTQQQKKSVSYSLFNGLPVSCRRHLRSVDYGHLPRNSRHRLFRLGGLVLDSVEENLETDHDSDLGFLLCAGSGLCRQHLLSV